MSVDKYLETVLQGLVGRYRQRVPDVGIILKAMVAEGIIAFRTLGVPHLGVGSLEKIFLHFGYTKRDYYFFKEKKLNAWWYAPPKQELPRIFISELRVGDLSKMAQDIIERYTKQVQADPVDRLDLSDTAAIDAYLHTSSWEVPSLADYQALASESEYAAWVIYNRYYLNHFTMAVHNLKEGYDTLEAFDAFLKRQGIILNTSGGEIKTSPDGMLLQSSTVAETVEATFKNGEKEMIPGSYVEFAERKVLEPYKDLPKKDLKPEYRREGFEAGNADKIFESTYLEQVGKR
jgi:hypothetical protein